MLYKLYCSEFTEKEITFHEGLNVVTGDEVASNSIGKSTILISVPIILPIFQHYLNAKHIKLIKNRLIPQNLISLLILISHQ